MESPEHPVRPRSQRRPRRTRPSTLVLGFRVGLLASVVALVIGLGIAWQMAGGGDPALGGAGSSTSVTVAHMADDSEEFEESDDSEESEASSDFGATTSDGSSVSTSTSSAAPVTVTTRSS